MNSSTRITMTLSNRVCTAAEVTNLTNGTTVNNITFYVYDTSQNLNQTSLSFAISDLTKPNVTSITISGVSSSGATVTVTTNESVNMSINSTGSNSFSSTPISTFAKSQSITIGGLSASAIYNLTVITCDKAGNCQTNTTLGFTTSAAAAAEEEEAASSGGGAGTAAVSNVADSKAQVWNIVPVGSSVSLNINKETIAITSVAVNNVKSELSNVDIEVQALKSKPVSAAAAAKVYQYLRINKKNIVDDDAESIKVRFRIPKSWLTDNNLASGDISLYRYKDDKWNRLVTKVTGTDDTYVNYEAETPGFSYFAVGSKAAASAELQVILDMIDSFYATGSPTLIEILDAIDAYYAAGGG
jgi:PGF-pre-PGF domain-containing protein